MAFLRGQNQLNETRRWLISSSSFIVASLPSRSGCLWRFKEKGKNKHKKVRTGQIHRNRTKPELQQISKKATLSLVVSRLAAEQNNWMEAMMIDSTTDFHSPSVSLRHPIILSVLPSITASSSPICTEL